MVRAQTVETGRIRINKAVREREERIDVPLVFEEVQIERRAVEPPRVVDKAPAIRQDGETIVIPILEERLVVEKRLVVKEELRVTRVRREQRDTRRVVLRSEHASVERVEPATGATAATPPRNRRGRSDQ